MVRLSTKQKELKISDKITFPGRIDYKKAPEYISLGDITISLKLSKTEANGKLYNYMACEKPTIATDNPINREILQETGIYVSPNKEDVAEKIIRLLKEEELSKSIGKAARKKAEDIHSWRSRSKLIEEVYKKCLESQ